MKEDCAYVFRKIKVLTLGIYLFGGTLLLFGGLSLVSFGNGSIPLEPSPYFRAQKDDINQTREFLIAHAGGTIDGISGTNSLEAVENSRDQQFSFFELDLLISKDNRIVAAHDWKHFLEITGFVGKKGAALRQAEFVKQKIH